MKEIKIWESNLKDKCNYLNNIEEFFNYLEQNNTADFYILNKYTPGNKPRIMLDNIANNKNLSITYTDNLHQVAIVNLGTNKDIIIDPSFYQKHKERIIEYTKKKKLEEIKTKPSFIEISDILISDEFIDIIINSDELADSTIYIVNDTGNNLTKEQIHKIKEHHLEVSIDGQLISTNKLIEYYTMNKLKNKTNLSVKANITKREIDNFIYIANQCEIEITSTNQKDEKKFIQDLVNIFNILKKHNRTYNIKIKINNRELLKQSGILNIDNINLIIHNDLHNYQKEEYLKEEEQLNKLIEPIKKAQLSPYEKYLAVYNLVKQFKPYKENNDNKEQARYLRYILNNEYIVCVGYSKLLKTLLDKVGIPCIEQSISVDISYDNGFTQEEIPTNLTGHARNIIKIDDKKYNIHGIYVADSTWDNDMEYDLYNNASMTFDRKKEAKRMENLTTEDLLLDFHSFEEFNQKINFYLNKEYRSFTKTYPHRKDKLDNLKGTYHRAFCEILILLSTLDYPKYQELYNKYDNQIKDNENNFQKLEQIYSNFLTEYATYILPLSNKKISKETLFNAAINTKKILNNYSKKQLKSIKEDISSTYNEYANISFPYEYNPNNTIPNYLEDTTNKIR